MPGSCTAAICTRNRPEQLRRALASLHQQTDAFEEVLVVDNAPDDASTSEMVRHHFPQVRYVREPVMGLDIARNRALREARHALVAFLDDDAVADRSWGHALRQAFEAYPRAAVCTGRVEPLALETDAQRLCEANGGFSRGSRRVRLPQDAGQALHGRRASLIAWAVSIGNGASMAVRRDVVLGFGGFDEALDLGEALPGGGDLDLFWRALQAGHEMVYEPSALAWHEHRRELPALSAQLAGHQRALIAFLCKTVSAPGRGRMAVVAFLGWRLLKPGVRLIGRGMGRDPLPVPILWRMWIAVWQGLWTLPAVRRIARERTMGRAGRGQPRVPAGAAS